MSQFAKIHNLTLVALAIEQLAGRAGGLPGLAVLYGDAGFGKSIGMQAAALGTKGYYVQLRSCWTRKFFLEKILIEMGVKPHGTIPQLLDQVCTQLAASRRPLLIDEADHAVKGNMIELIRDIYEGSQSSIMLAGEELLPRKLEKWERFHSRVLTWIPAQPVTLADAALLADVYCKGLKVADDLLAHLVKISGGSVRRVCVNLSIIGNAANLNGQKKVNLSDYADKPFFTGQAPRRAS